MTPDRIAAIVLLLTGVVLPETIGWLDDTYHPSAAYLSELGAVNAPYQLIMNLAGFLPVGLCVLVLVYNLRARLPGRVDIRMGLVCLLGVSVGYLGAVAFPCDAGCPASGSSGQTLHDLAGVLEYLGAVIGLFLIAAGCRTTHRLFSIFTLAAALTVASGFLLMVQPDLAHLRGLSQRLADYTIFTWFGLAVGWLPSAAAHHAAPAWQTGRHRD